MPNEVKVKASVDDKVTGPVSQIEKKFEKFGKTAGLAIGGNSEMAKGVGLAAGVAGFGLLSGAVTGAVGAVFDSIAASSSLNESLAKSKVVFGENAGEIEAWASTAATAFGQSKQQALEAAGTYGNLFQAFGVGRDESTKMSKSLVQLASDLASFNNTSVDDALVALRSGLSGETEPLKRYGIAISDARMRTELMSEGQKNLGATLTPNQKSMAAYALIMKDSVLAQGDFARSSNGLAEKQKTLDAKLADLSATIGETLVPVMSDLASVTISVVDGFKSLGVGADHSMADVEAAAKKGSRSAEIELARMKAAADATANGWDESTNRIMTDVEGMRGSIDWGAGEIKKDIHGVGTETSRTASSMGKSFQRMESALADLAATAIGSYFDPIIEHDKLMATQAQIAAAKRVIASSKATAAEKADARSTLHELTKSTTESRIKLFEAGKLSRREQGTLLRDLKADYRSATGDAKSQISALIAKIEELQRHRRVDITVVERVQTSGGRLGKNGFASGGRPAVGDVALVGENGPELFVPDTAGTIVTAARTKALAQGGSSGHPHLIQLVLDRRGMRVLAEVLADESSYDRPVGTFAPA